MLNGDSSLNVSTLIQPFNVLTNHAQMAQLALQQQNGGMPVMMSNGGGLGSEEPGEKKKRKKRAYKQRDPNAPKRPLTAYFRYLGENRAGIQQEIADNPDLFQTPGKPGDISRIATDRWNNLTKDQQEPYRQAYQAALKDYEKDVTEYKNSGGKVEDSQINDETHIDMDADAEEETPAKAAAEKESEDENTSSEDESDEEEERPAPPPPPPAKTPKSALKKGKQSNVQPAAAPVFSSLNAQERDPAPSSSPSHKRKAGSEEEKSRKKRGAKSKEVVEESPPPAPATVVAPPPSSPEAPASKKKKKDKKRKSNA